MNAEMTNKQAENLLATIKEAVYKRVPMLADLECEEIYNQIIETIVKLGAKDTENLCKLSKHYELMTHIYKERAEDYDKDEALYYYYDGLRKGYGCALENLRVFFPILKGEEDDD